MVMYASSPPVLGLRVTSPPCPTPAAGENTPPTWSRPPASARSFTAPFSEAARKPGTRTPFVVFSSVRFRCVAPFTVVKVPPAYTCDPVPGSSTLTVPLMVGAKDVST